MRFLPTNRNEMKERGWSELDFLFITGDSYIDHPSFGVAILTRLLEDKGYRVGVIARPDVDDPLSIQAMGRPRHGVLVSSGVVDSMVNNYTAAKKRRRDDRYKAERDNSVRPDRALIVYCNLVRRVFGDIPLIIGGIEASLRRFAHYDYWSGTVRRSILQDSRADILNYGMGERVIPQICDFLAKGVPVRSLTTLAGTCVLTSFDHMSKQQRAFAQKFADRNFDETRDVRRSHRIDYLLPREQKMKLLPSFEQTRDSKIAYCAAFMAEYEEQDPADGFTLLQKHSHRWLIQNPPDAPLTTAELDHVYGLPYARRAHPSYDNLGRMPAIEEVRFSITAHRGCFGGCNFCAITMHQGRIVQARSDESILAEAVLITELDDFKGYIHDVGGPTANFHQPACKRQAAGGVCKHRQCLSPVPCKELTNDASAYFQLLRKIRALPKVKKVFVRSGILFDALMADRKDHLAELCDHHISGQLKVAPEHISRPVLRHMGKPTADVYQAFREAYAAYNESIGKKQYLVPYLMSGHPGCTMDDAIELAFHIKQNRVMPEQVQDFYPTPGTVSTTMYYTGLDPRTLRPVHVPKGREKLLQRALLQFSRPENRSLAIQALRMAGREDLIGQGEECLFAPLSPRGRPAQKNSRTRTNVDGFPSSKSKSTRHDRRSRDQTANREQSGKKRRGSGQVARRGR